MAQGQQPGEEEHADLPALPGGQLHRQQPVGGEVGGQRAQQAGERGDVESVHQPQRGARRLAAQLLGALGHPQQHAGGDHGGAAHAEQEEQPAHGGVGEARQVQVDQQVVDPEGAGHRLVARSRFQQLAGAAVEHQGGVAAPALVGDVGIFGRGYADHRVVPVGPVHADAAHRLVEGVPGARHQRRDVHHRHRRAALGGGLLARKHVLEEAAPAVFVGRVHAPGHQHHHENQQARIGDHEMKRQRQHRRGVVAVQPGALALAGPEGEEILEDFLVGDHPADDRHQHEHGRHADQPACPDTRHPVQLKVKAVKKVAAPAGARRQQLAGAGVHHRLLAAPAAAFLGLGCVRLPAQLHHRGAGLGQLNVPAFRVRGLGVERRPGQRRGIRRRLRVVQLRRHPQGDLLAEIGAGAGHEHRQQQPAQQQAAPGVQPGHGLPQTRLHNSASGPPSQASAASTSAGIRMPTQARAALRVANAHSTATV